ncbi:MAG: ribonuclease J, partial [Anaerolineae bacterium]|nr:ribonuclease J [Anaerolineae bacterium]
EVLARDGFMMVVVTVDQKSGELVEEPEIISRGFVYLKDSSDLLKTVKATVNDVFTHSQNGNRRDKLNDNLGRVLYNETRRRPMIFTVINER